MSSLPNCAIFVVLKIVIINYGLGNLGSVKNMLKKVGCQNVVISDDEKEIQTADKLILPGVGAFDYGMQQLKKKKLVDILHREVRDKKKPILGICLGAQLLCQGSEEGEEPGLGWVDAQVRKFEVEEQGLKVPHMAWNTVEQVRDHAVLKDFAVPSRFYFVHSYYIECGNRDDILLTADYGIEFCAAMQNDNVIGMQFHPEKSHKFGMQVFKNFAAL